MNTKLVILGALAMLAAPLAYAHDPAGTPKNYCEPQSEWGVHDYGAPASGSLLLLNEDGNLFGDCDGSTSVAPGSPCYGVDPADPVNSFYAGLCDSEVNLPIADYDGHREFALGGGWLLAGANALECFGDEAHHAEFGTYSVEDTVLGSGASFSVAADTVDATGQLGTCGDFESDASQDCIGACSVGFPAGLDGSYQLYVQGTSGHIRDGGVVVSLCGPDLIDVTGVDPLGGNNYHGQVTIKFTVGILATLTAESVTWTGGPSPNPNPIAETGHTGTGGGSVHTWTIGGSMDFETREFTYTFTTTCSVDGSVRTTTGTVNVYN
jgi:hypothetical protein